MSNNKRKYANRSIDRFLLFPVGKKLWCLLAAYLIVATILVAVSLWWERPQSNPPGGAAWSVNTIKSGPNYAKDILNSEQLRGHRSTTVFLIALSLCGAIGWSFFTAFLMAMHNRREANVQNGQSRYKPVWKKHGVILGWGPMGVSAVKKLRAEYKCEDIVVLSRVNAGLIRRDLRAAFGANGQDVPNWLFIYSGPSEAPEHLGDLALEAAERLLYLGDPDTEDTLHDSQALSMLTQVAKLTKGREKPLPCHVCILSISLFNLLASKDIPEQEAKGIQFHPFSPYGNWAKRLWSLIPAKGAGAYRPLAYRPLTAGSTVHLFVIGFGNMGRALALHAIKIAHYPCDAGLQVTVVDPALDTLKDDFLATVPVDCLSPFRMTFDFIQAKAEAPEVRSRLVEAVSDARQIVTVAVCIPVPDAALETALQLPREIADSGTPVLVRQGAPLPPDSGFVSASLLTGLTLFGSTDDCGLDRAIDSLARSAHDVYIEGTKAAGKYNPDKKASHRPWDKIPAIKRLSNLNQTDAIRERLAAWGYGLEPSDKADVPVSPDDIETIAEAEHRRWWTEYVLAGWKVGPADDSLKRTHPDMRPYQELDRGTQDYDRSVAKSMPELLYKVYGVRIFKKREDNA